MGFWDWLRTRGRVERSAASLLETTTTPPPRPTPTSPSSSGFAVIDVETTGLSPNSHRVLELAIVLCDPLGRPQGEWVTRLNPQGPVGATHIHGITDADVRDAPLFADLVPHISDRLRGRALVAHNARFDLAFLRSEYDRAGWRMPYLPSLCTLDASRTLLPDLPRRRLPDCCAATGVAHSHAHSALGDARAASGLLRWYLGQEADLAQSVWAVAMTDALAVAWPTTRTERAGGPSADARVRRQPQRARPTVASRQVPQPRLATLLRDFPLREALTTGTSDGAVAYLELVAESLEDGVLDDSEREALNELAAVYDLEDDSRREVHSAFVRALAARAVEDGRVVAREWDELVEVGGMLDLGRHEIDEVVRAAKESRLRRLGDGLRPLPAGWEYGEPLRLDDAVVFTGCEAVGRDALERRAERAGLRVMSSVSGRTALVVSDGSVEGNKVADARRLGTRVVTPEVFAVLVDNVQPAEVAEARPVAVTSARVATTRDPRVPRAPRAALQGVLPSEVRRWARENGFEIGDRGRLPQDVLDAYVAARSDEGRSTEPVASRS